MNPRFRKVAVFGSAAALATGVGVGVAVASQGNDTASSQAAGSQRAGMPGGYGARGGMDVSALAEKLGVSTDKLQAAMQAVRPSAGAAPQPGGLDTMAAALAKQLGLSTDKVTAALEALRPQGAPPGTPPNGSTAPDSSTAPDDSATGTTAA
jgi:UDP-N-acetylmuramyl pentapeptide synthase